MARRRLFVDTNVFLRFLTRDDPAKAEDCRALFQRAEQGEVDLVINDMVVAELVWTLRSYYRLPKQEVVESVRDILGMRSLRIPRKALLLEALGLYESLNVDFIDAYNAFDSRRKGVDGVCSYDEDFDRLSTFRVEPGSI
ncbi:MAG TPA: type II toxin-antitoxin system VapC family toxin [Dehalococcoidia bacterium]|nr:type II toxin-antitoxin system VapC family toxin [Dehalococcoidia bacterium]